MKRFFEIQKFLLESNFSLVREMYTQIDFQQRLIGLVGPRGVGKTTLLLRYISDKNLNQSLYISADNIYFLENTLFDFAFRFKTEYDGKLLIVDEIHKYKNWQQELKNIYDSLPNLQVIFSGSSSIDLKTGNYDLSRRAKLYHLNGFSFREYINYLYGWNLPTFSLEDIKNKHLEIAQNLPDLPLLGYFHEYLVSGYYPYYVNEDRKDHSKIIETIDKTIYDDIAKYYSIKTENLRLFKKILNYLSVMDPGEVNSNKISKTLEIDNKTVHNYLEILVQGGLVRFLLQDIYGYSIMKNTSKVYLDNPNLLYSINFELQKEVKIGLVRETFFVNALQTSQQKIIYSKVGDFQINDTLYEVGGKNKSFKQLKKSTAPAFVVADDCLVGEKNVIPLYLFGFLS